MKNTKLVKVKDILSYIGVMDNIIQLKEKEYGLEDVIKIFKCSKDQVRGYRNGYKEIFGEHAKTIGVNGAQKTVFTKQGLFLLAILLGDKTELSSLIFNAVDEEHTKREIEEKFISSKSKKENVKSITEPKEEKIDSKSVFDEIKRIISNVDISDINVEVIDMSNDEEISLDELVYRLNDADLSPEQEEMLKLLENLNLRYEEEEMERQSQEDEEMELSESEVESLLDILSSIKENIEQESIDYDIIQRKNFIAKAYIERCEILGIPSDEAARLVQGHLVDNEINMRAIESDILELLYLKKKEENDIQRGVLREAIELLAENSFDGNYEEAYHHISHELRFVIGIDMQKHRALQKKKHITPTSYLDLILKHNAFYETLDIIDLMLS